MNKKFYFIVAFMISLLALSGCRTAPVLNITDAPIAIKAKYSESDVKGAITRAGGALGWIVKENGPGKMTGTLVLRKHVAVVAISYSKKSYSIQYKDSTNLDYDGTGIHGNYNGWVQNLDRNIQVQLANL